MIPLSVDAGHIALAIVVVIIAGTIAFALFNLKRGRVDPAEYAIGGRSFGTIFLWVLLAGEIYTAFTFLGAAGWIYLHGAAAYYIPAYGTIGYLVGYALLPRIRRLGAERGLVTAPDLLANYYQSAQLGTLAAIFYVVLALPYVTLQLSGLQIVLSSAGYGWLNGAIGAAVAFTAIALFTFTAGLRGTAWASLIKDGLVLAVVLFAGIAIPIHFFGSLGGMFTQLQRTNPALLTLQHGDAPLGQVWFVTTVLFTGIGFYMGPHSIAATFSARSDNTLRRNAMLLPLYSIVLVVIFFAGYAALLLVPGLHGHAADRSFLLVIARYYPPWVMGFVAGAGALAALVPSSAIILACAAIAVRNIVRPAFPGRINERNETFAMRLAVIAISTAALLAWWFAPETLGSLLLVYYSGITQFLPGVVGAAFGVRIRGIAVTLGLLAGVATAALLTYALAHLGFNPGFGGLIVNLAVIAAVEMLLPKTKTSPPMASPSHEVPTTD